MNIPFCARVRRLRASEVWVMFHEVATPWAPWRQWKRNVGSAASRVMVRMLLDRADRVFVSIPMWEPLLRAIAPRWQGAVTWLPVPSSVPTCVSFADVGAVRTRLPIVGGGAVIGHFGSYGPLIAPLVEKTVLDLVERDPRRVVLLVGRGSDAMAATLKRASRPESRILGTGSLDPSQIAVQLAACDVLVQPYHDGVSSRRTSVMAGLALGVPTVTNEGALTEPLWRPSGAVQLARSVNDIVDQTDAVLANRGLAEQIASNGRALYNQMFAIELTIKRLRCARAPETI
jgi:glycosyltransferase involved in cell wall biosynthesis